MAGGRARCASLALLGALALGCARSSDGGLTEGNVASRTAQVRASQRDRVQALGVGPGLRTLAGRSSPRGPAQDPVVTAQAVLNDWLLASSVPRGSLPKWSVEGVTSAHGRRVVSLAHSVDGVPVWHARTTVLLSADGRPTSVTGLPEARAPLGTFDLASQEAARIAWRQQRPDAPSELSFVGLGADGLERYALPQTLTSGPSLLGPVRVSRVYFPTPAGLVPAFAVVVGSEASGHDRRGEEIVVSARDGSILAVRSTLASAHSYRVWTADDAGTPAEGPLGSILPYPTSEPSGASPLPVPSKLIEVEGLNTNPDGAADPWLPAGATSTLGNNVDAYVDFQDPDGLGAGEFRASVTSTGVFDHTYVLGEGPLFNTTQSSAAIVQAFYTANWLHDWYYDSGFDEAAKNAQTDNFDRGGFDGDVLHIQVQDAAQSSQPGRDNANMYTPPDGVSPIMQVYVWSALATTTIEASPGGALPSRYAAFGPTAFDVSAQLVAVNDGTADTMDGCQALTQDLTGKIALLRRGGCPFVQKADAATDAGALGVIIADDAAGTPPIMDGDSDTAAPTLSTSQAAGDALVQALGNGSVTVALTRTPAVERDGALDGTIVAHEWGHYLQDRLAPCAPTAIVNNAPLPSQCHAMGEGGGDFVALHMLLAADADPAQPYPMAAYAAAALVPDLYYGLRRVPYSTDLEIDPLTFRHIEDGQALPSTSLALPSGAPNAEVHNAGEVWATMLFEVYAALLANGEGSFEEIRRNMSDDLVLALSMMPFERTLLDARDALLAAIFARSQPDALAAAQAFAKRGAGSCAVAPAFDSTTNAGVVEDFEVSPRLEVGLVFGRDEECENGEDGVLDAGETGALVVEIVNLGHGVASGTTVTLSDLPAEFSTLEGAEVVLDVPPLATAHAEFPLQLDDVTEIVEGSVTVTVEANGGCSPVPEAERSFSLNYDVDDAGSSVDDFAVDSGSWSAIGGKSDAIWNRSGVGEATLWHGADYDMATNTALVSPAVEVSSTEPFSITLTHRYSFESTEGTFWDGGVIEISEDDGETWVDAADYAGVDVGYSGAITSLSDNPLTAVTGSDRPAFVGDSASYPNLESLEIDFGDELSGKTIRVAFRIGTDMQEGAPGWAIDDVTFSGVERGPFPARKADTTAAAPCPIPVSTGGTGGSGQDGSGATPSQATSGGQGNQGSGGESATGGSGGAAVAQPGGCGCRVANAPGSGPASALGLGFLLLAQLWRRRPNARSARARSAA